MSLVVLWSNGVPVGISFHIIPYGAHLKIAMPDQILRSVPLLRINQQLGQVPHLRFDQNRLESPTAKGDSGLQNLLSRKRDGFEARIYTMNRDS